MTLFWAYLIVAGCLLFGCLVTVVGLAIIGSGIRNRNRGIHAVETTKDWEEL